MKNLFLILFFSKFILITPQPIDINDTIELNTSEPISAITSGAHITVDVSSMIQRNENEDLSEYHNRHLTKFPKNSIKAILENKHGDKVALIYKGAHSHSGDNQNEKIKLLLFAEEGVPNDKEFTMIKITSEVNLKNVLVTWVNFDM